VINFIPDSYARQNSWKDDLWLLTPEEVDSLRAGTTLTSIMNRIGVTGQDTIDQDTRFGYTAWGVFRSEFQHLIKG
jgi:hypothetical protein